MTRSCGKFLKRWDYQTTWPASWEICIRSGSNSWSRLVPNRKRNMSSILYIVTLGSSPGSTTYWCVTLDKGSKILQHSFYSCKILWPPDVKSWFIWKDPNAGKDWGQEEKGTTEDEMVGWHHWLDGHGFGKTPGVGDGQGGLVCCGSWGHKESDTTERLNWTEPFMAFSRKEYWSGLPFSSPVYNVLSEISTMTHLSWVAVYVMAHSFIELDKAMTPVIRLDSFL